MSKTINKPEPDDVFTYRRLRRSIGYLGACLPIVLVILSLFDFFKTKIQPSISHYYYSNFREIFTGTLCAVGLFLIRYRGKGNKKWWLDDCRLTNFAGFMAFGVALVPTNPEDGTHKIWTLIPLDEKWLGWLHYGFAAALFLTVANLSINVFTQGQKVEPGTPKSMYNENNIYRICGYSIIGFIILVPVLAGKNIIPCSTLILEALSLFSFGIAWLIKGRALGDKGWTGRNLYREKNK
jgi:hypothetical protein